MLIKVYKKPRLNLRLRKVDQSLNFWTFHFWDPDNRFSQAAIVPKSAPWEAVEAIWDEVHERFKQALLERQWLH